MSMTPPRSWADFTAMASSRFAAPSRPNGRTAWREDIWRCSRRRRRSRAVRCRAGPSASTSRCRPRRSAASSRSRRTPGSSPCAEAVLGAGLPDRRGRLRHSLSRAPRTSRGTATFPSPEATPQGPPAQLASPSTSPPSIPARSMARSRSRRARSGTTSATARDGMFPDRSLWPRYIERAVQKLPQRGDISARSALTIHRGTANRSNEPRPVLVVGVDAPDATNARSSRPAGHAGLCRTACRRRSAITSACRHRRPARAGGPAPCDRGLDRHLLSDAHDGVAECEC